MLKSMNFLRGKSRERVSGGGTSVCSVILRRYSQLVVPWRRIHNVIAHAMSVCVAVGNKVMGTRLPQPAGCGDKYDASGWCRGHGFSLGARKQRSVAYSNKVMDTRLPQPAGCGDKYDVYGWCWERMFSAFCMFFKYPSPEAYALPSPSRGEGSGLLRCARNDGTSNGEGLYRPWCNKILGTDCASRPRMTGGRGANPFGRSMIEMLGVLAIIGVLSVAGIAGYSKAMEKFRLTKALGDYSMLINGLIEYKDNIRKIKTNDALYGLVDVVQSLNLVPETWKKVSAMHISDNYGNVLRIYSNNMNSDYVFYVVDFYLGGTKTSDKGTEVSSGFSTKLCLGLLTDLVAPLETAIASVNIWHTPDTSHAIGISKSKFHDLIYLHYACNSCGQDEACAISVIFNY